MGELTVEQILAYHERDPERLAGAALQYRTDMYEARAEAERLYGAVNDATARLDAAEKRIEGLLLVNSSMEAIYDRLATSVGMGTEARGDVEELLGRIDELLEAQAEVARIQPLVDAARAYAQAPDGNVTKQKAAVLKAAFDLFARVASGEADVERKVASHG